ncbi:hypothetical protein C8F04DRAFT_1177518 [Mycena alexandri]|uniref:Uncharacterized protein n=1 Tax=Mycena alexandri TaxID=1745969 RepID=A0AAD6XD54_9AGAR|nr:hypothetical protein C8F04DRAFT_1177518 [Mycena alexandri]
MGQCMAGFESSFAASTGAGACTGRKELLERTRADVHSGSIFQSVGADCSAGSQEQGGDQVQTLISTPASGGGAGSASNECVATSREREQRAAPARSSLAADGDQVTMRESGRRGEHNVTAGAFKFSELEGQSLRRHLQTDHKHRYDTLISAREWPEMRTAGSDLYVLYAVWTGAVPAPFAYTELKPELCRAMGVDALNRESLHWEQGAPAALAKSGGLTYGEQGFTGGRGWRLVPSCREDAHRRSSNRVQRRSKGAQEGACERTASRVREQRGAGTKFSSGDQAPMPISTPVFSPLTRAESMGAEAVCSPSALESTSVSLCRR